MKKSVNELKQGDIVYINLNPTKGHEQQGKRPCIILGKR
ncbi:TPA: type II toxin-antitoxin system PemK/MazF family toxin, partial [Enterococcus faecalis]|nr:type II toxin-antitoxin system PemK/MazF family toxin [Enterococcus faecalis]